MLARFQRWIKPDRLSGRALTILTLALLFVICVTYWAFENTLIELAKLDGLFVTGELTYSVSLVRHDYRVFIGVVCAALVALSLGLYLWERTPPRIQTLAYGFAWTTLCAALVLRMLSFGAYEGTWYPIETILFHSQERAIYGHRLLFAWPTQAVVLWTGLSAKQAFGIVQTTVAWFAIASVGMFCRNFGGALFAGMGQGAFTLLLVGMIDYFNLYDIGITLFFALGLTAALAKRWWLFAVIVGAATLNHENALLLIPTALAAMWGLESGLRLTQAGIVALMAHVAARAVMVALMPMEKVFDLRFWSNPHLIAHPTLELVHSITILGPCLFAAAFGFSRAPGPLRRMTILLPMLLGITYLFGKVTEPRQFNAILPIAAALIACGAARVQGDAPETT